MRKLKGKLLVAQGGGPTAVINQSMVGIALEARHFDLREFKAQEVSARLQHPEGLRKGKVEARHVAEVLAGMTDTAPIGGKG